MVQEGIISYENEDKVVLKKDGYLAIIRKKIEQTEKSRSPKLGCSRLMQKSHLIPPQLPLVFIKAAGLSPPDDNANVRYYFYLSKNHGYNPSIGLFSATSAGL